MKAELVPVMKSAGNWHFKPRHTSAENAFYEWVKRFWRRNGILIIAMILIALWTWVVSVISAKKAREETEARLSVQYAAEYEDKLAAYIEEQEAVRRVIGDESVQAQISKEADAIARVIGKMNTKRMKQTEIWNILMRVDSPFYPNTVEEVVNSPQQWMFFDPEASNPIRDDDRALAIEQLQLWHDGRYPAGLSAEFVYGEWSSADYVLRDRWEKDSRTQYWRMPE